MSTFGVPVTVDTLLNEVKIDEYACGGRKDERSTYSNGVLRREVTEVI